MLFLKLKTDFLINLNFNYFKQKICLTIYDNRLKLIKEKNLLI